jgi:hypothetical protein
MITVVATLFPLAEHRRLTGSAMDLERAGRHREAQEPRQHAEWLSDLWSVALAFGRCRNFDAVRTSFPFERWQETRAAMLDAWDTTSTWSTFVERFGVPAAADTCAAGTQER